MSEQNAIRINEVERYSMFSEARESGKRARLAWCIRAGNPRISVYTNDPADTVGKGIIPAPMNPETFFLFLSQLEQVCDMPNGTKFKLENQTSNKDESGVSKKIHLSDLYFGKDNEGVIWLSLQAPGRPKIKFSYAMSDYHMLCDGEGRPLGKAVVSQLLCKSCVQSLRNIYSGLTAGFRENKTPYTPAATTQQTNTSTGNSFDDMPF